MIHTTMKHMETRLLLVAFFMIGSIEVLQWEEKRKEVRTMPQAIAHEQNAHQLHQGNFEFCHWWEFDISKSFVK
jgi:hypothetical protein